MLARGLVIILAVLAATPAAAAESSRVLGGKMLLLIAGERVITHVFPDGHLEIVSNDPATRPGGGNPQAKAPDGSIAFTLDVDPNGTNLRIENATGQSLDYGAAMLDRAQLPARAEPTSVCTVMPHLINFENWQQRKLPAMLLTGFSLSDSKQAHCATMAPPASAPPAKTPVGATPTN